MTSAFDLKNINDAVNDIDILGSKKTETVTPRSDSQQIYELVTKHSKCPACGGGVKKKIRSDTKQPMTVYSDGEVRHLLHVESRCTEEHCK